MRTEIDIFVAIGDAREQIQFPRKIDADRYDILNQRFGGPERRLFEIGIAVQRGNAVRNGVDVFLFRPKPAGAGAVLSAYANADPVLGLIGCADDLRDRSHETEIFGLRIFLFGIDLFGKEDEFPVQLGIFDRGEREPSPDVELHRSIGKNHRFPHRNDR